ncbi:NADH-quinone oxidoreductase subunit NuoN [Phaeovibrio sulfidiphilus]|uniref:NADH-quinone oxidoreductase subunit N n=1 Tax=Phaeovibrio sulfidiphilus TaxID=1220600 RepID=A0A8J6YLQ5_9PROT|nr:NADH-quinone oxidoreductase subunit NuoN [Phaeovibrio sulfidiphilus]MBE1237075.1 NADH-quinone oxidoreductase subunit NuoN [Phaeovibrio sulfidiphilus]
MDINLVPATPEIVLAVFGLALLVIGAFVRKDAGALVSRLAFAGFGVTLALVCLMAGWTTVQEGLNGLFIDDAFARFAKILVLASAMIVLAMSESWFRRDDALQAEFPVLVVFAVVGMMVMVSANDLMAVYMGVELQSFALYILAAYQRTSAKSTEAGVKYFILGALASAVMLYGMSLVYGFAGTTHFAGIAHVAADGARPVGIVVGLVFVAAGFAFKVSAVPFHMWAPDVYEGAPTPITAFFAVAPKIAALALFARVMVDPFGPWIKDWQQVLLVLSILSMSLGAVAAIAQTNIKRLMAYSSIGHVGYALIGITAGTHDGIRGMLVYLAIYLVMNVATFALILSMRQGGQPVERLSDLAGLSRTAPWAAAAVTVLMFSMAGIPPLAGFFGKFYVFMAAIDAKLYTLAIIGVVTSVIGAFYYLRIVKIMYFDEVGTPLDEFTSRVNSSVLFGGSALVLLGFLGMDWLVTSAQFAGDALLKHAAAALF